MLQQTQFSQHFETDLSPGPDPTLGSVRQERVQTDSRGRTFLQHEHHDCGPTADDESVPHGEFTGSFCLMFMLSQTFLALKKTTRLFPIAAPPGQLRSWELSLHREGHIPVFPEDRALQQRRRGRDGQDDPALWLALGRLPQQRRRLWHRRSGVVPKEDR